MVHVRARTNSHYTYSYSYSYTVYDVRVLIWIPIPHWPSVSVMTFRAYNTSSTPPLTEDPMLMPIPLPSRLSTMVMFFVG